MIQLENERSLTQNKEPEYRIRPDQPFKPARLLSFNRNNHRFWQNNPVPRYPPQFDVENDKFVDKVDVMTVTAWYDEESSLVSINDNSDEED
ncbi:hypothetical protein DERF_006745 [Dermatophagoides farinae]|uniref:Uncharacterized protein n=1 Tax=Dermatophagoides farinae TaxID=6954 RepID=A0A922HZ21_DERFA|nr:hypothetical protein DERF_006745 [Dermatophagoides farinae]